MIVVVNSLEFLFGGDIRYLIYISTLFSFLFSRDDEPPFFYCEDNGMNCSQALDYPFEVDFSNGAGSLIFWTLMDIKDSDPENPSESSSGVRSIGLEFIRSDGYIEDIYISGSMWNTQYSGSLSNYITEGLFNIDGYAEGGGYFIMNIPSEAVELGIYDIRFIAEDYAGNQMILEGDELLSIEPPNLVCESGEECFTSAPSSAIRFIGDMIPDIDPPFFYCEDNGMNCSQALNFSTEINFDGYTGDFSFYLLMDILDNNPGNPSESSSGVRSIGLEFISPYGEVEDIFITGSINNQFTGTLSNYVMEGFFTIDGGSAMGGDLLLRIPLNEVNLGTFEFRFIAEDYSGNQMILEGDELLSIEHPNLVCESGEECFTSASSSTILFESNYYSTTYNPFEDYAILSWDWGYGDNIIIQESAFNLFEDGDTLYAIDDNALISSDCSDPEPYGPAILDKYSIMDYVDEFSLYCNGSIDDCNENNLRFPGFVEGNTMKFKYYDNSEGEYYDILPDYSSGNGQYGVPFDDTLTFKYYDQSENIIYDVEETFIFSPNMILGDNLTPIQMHIDYSSGINETPDWNVNYGYFYYNGAIISTMYNGNNIILEDGDLIAAFVNNQCRGTNGVLVSDGGPFVDAFELQVYANPSVTRISSFEIDQRDRNNNNLISLSDRSGYNYNIYKNDILIEENYTEQFLTDYNIYDGENCYEIYLIDNYDNSEFLSTDQLCFYSELETEYISGDVTQDGFLNVLDIVLLVDWILNGASLSDLETSIADMTSDGFVNVLDIVALVDTILNP